jgi:hypothetical protein
MSLRTKIIASIAFAASAFLLAPAAQAASPVQVNGAKLKSALLPASAFGSGFKVLGASSSGKSLWHQTPAKHVATMSCANFENQGLTRYGESAVATSAILNKNSTNITSLSNLNLLYDQTVYQFPSAKAAAAFYNQAHGKFAACKSFSEAVPGNPGGKLTFTLKSIAKTKVGTHQAFKIAQGVGGAGLTGVSLNFETLVTVAGADVFVVVDFTTANQPVPAKTMLKLVDRVKALR